MFAKNLRGLAETLGSVLVVLAVLAAVIGAFLVLDDGITYAPVTVCSKEQVTSPSGAIEYRIHGIDNATGQLGVYVMDQAGVDVGANHLDTADAYDATKIHTTYSFSYRQSTVPFRSHTAKLQYLAIDPRLPQTSRVL